MKKASPLSIFLVLLIISLACQTVINSPQLSQTDIPEPVNTKAPTEIVDPTPSTEGWIAFVNKNNIWLVHPDGTGLEQVNVNDDPDVSFGKMKWSPDGKWLAYSYIFDEVPKLYLYNLASNETTVLLEKLGGGFDWLHNSKEIIYDTPRTFAVRPKPWRNDGIWTMNIENGDKKQVFQTEDNIDGPGGPDLSPNDEYIMASSPLWGAGIPVIVNLSSDNYIYMYDYVPSIVNCNWVPVGLTIACTALVAGNDTEIHSALFLLDVEGNVLRKIPLPVEMGRYPSGKLAPDGRELAVSYALDNSDSAKTQTHIISLDSQNDRSLAPGYVSDWSSDGKWLVTIYSGLDKNGIEVSNTIYVVNTSSGEYLSVGEGESAIWQPSTNAQTIVTDEPATELTATRVVLADPTNTLSSIQAPCTSPSISINDTPKGNILQICADNKVYEIGPLESGAFAIGPNKKFFVYATNSGSVYASRFGSTTMDLIGDVKDFSIIVREEAPQYEFEFFGDHPYTVKVNETILKQNKTLSIPRYITTPN